MGDAAVGDRVEEPAVPNTGPDVEGRWITVEADGTQVRGRIVRPAGGPEALPVVLYLHGGSWISGNAATHERLVRELSVGACAAVVSIGCDRAPDTRHAAASRRGGVLTILATRPREVNFIHRFWNTYLPSEHGDAVVSPLWAGLDDVAGSPDAFVIVDEYDMLRDEAEAYASRMTAARERSDSTLHDFMMLNPVRDPAGASAAIAQASLVLRDALNSPCLLGEKEV